MLGWKVGKSLLGGMGKAAESAGGGGGLLGKLFGGKGGAAGGGGTEIGKGVMDGLKNFITGIIDVLKTVATQLGSLGKAIIDGVFTIVNSLLDGLGSAAQRLPKIMTALGEAVVAFFKPMSALVNPFIIAGVAIFTGAMIGLGYAFNVFSFVALSVSSNPVSVSHGLPLKAPKR